jgi:hypothetical protein
VDGLDADIATDNGLRGATERPRASPENAHPNEDIRHRRTNAAAVAPAPVEQVEELRSRDGVLSMPRGNGRVDAEAASTLQLATARGEETPHESLHNFAFLCGEAMGAIGGNSLGQEVITAYSGSFGDAKIRVVEMPVDGQARGNGLQAAGEREIC